MNHLTKAEYDEALKMREEGMSFGAIALAIGRSKGGVHKSLTSVKRDNLPDQHPLEYQPLYKQQRLEWEEIDLSSLPDTVLFRHKNFPIP